MPQKPTRLAEILTAHGVASQLELLLLNRLEQAGLPLGEGQGQIVPGRRWKFDRIWPDATPPLAVEVQGGTFSPKQEGHNRGSKIENDCRKTCAAVVLGWRVLPVTRTMITEGLAVTLIAAALGLEARPCPANTSRPPAASRSSAREARPGSAATTATDSAPATSVTGRRRSARAAPATATSVVSAPRPTDRNETTAAITRRSGSAG